LQFSGGCFPNCAELIVGEMAAAAPRTTINDTAILGCATVAARDNLTFD
jgi:hypothetical protein